MNSVTRLEAGDAVGAGAALLACAGLAAGSFAIRSVCTETYVTFGVALPVLTDYLCEYWWHSFISAFVAAVPALLGVSMDAPLPLRRMLIVMTYIAAVGFMAITTWGVTLPFHSL